MLLLRAYVWSYSRKYIRRYFIDQVFTLIFNSHMQFKWPLTSFCLIFILPQYLKKLHTQERAVEEVKLAIKPYYQRKDINKDEYKDILRKAVHKVNTDFLHKDVSLMGAPPALAFVCTLIKKLNPFYLVTKHLKTQCCNQV